MVGFVRSTVTRRSSATPRSLWDYRGFPCRDGYGRIIVRGVLPSHYIPPSVHDYSAQPGAAFDFSLHAPNAKWNKSTLFYIVLALVVLAVLGKFIQRTKDGLKIKGESRSRLAYKQVALKVPICCADCELFASEALMTVPGVLDVECDHMNEKVTVTVVGDVPAANLLLKCRSLKIFRKSDYWK